MREYSFVTSARVRINAKRSQRRITCLALQDPSLDQPAAEPLDPRRVRQRELGLGQRPVLQPDHQRELVAPQRCHPAHR
jgi:hypothetical protein